MNDQAIGFFDSGVGGLSVWRATVALLPGEDTCYLADSAHAPYGTQSREAIRARCQKNVEKLLEKRVKLIVVACNTATTTAIEQLRARYAVPLIGIEPAIKPAALQTRSGKVAVLATQGTLGSALFEQTAQRFGTGIGILIQEGKGLVEQVEKNAVHSAETEQLLRGQLEPIQRAGVDCLVLGCTHYAFLTGVIRKIVGPEMQILDTSQAVARQTKRILTQRNLCRSRPGTAVHHIWTNGDRRVAEALTKAFRPAQTQIRYKAF